MAHNVLKGDVRRTEANTAAQSHVASNAISKSCVICRNDWIVLQFSTDAFYRAVLIIPEVRAVLIAPSYCGILFCWPMLLHDSFIDHSRGESYIDSPIILWHTVILTPVALYSSFTCYICSGSQSVARLVALQSKGSVPIRSARSSKQGSTGCEKTPEDICVRLGTRHRVIGTMPIPSHYSFWSEWPELHAKYSSTWRAFFASILHLTSS